VVVRFAVTGPNSSQVIRYQHMEVPWHR